MKKSIVFWGPPSSGKNHNANICSLCFKEKAIIETTAKGFKPEQLKFNQQIGTELIIVDECFEEEQIHELEIKIRKFFVSSGIVIIYLFQSETIPLYMDITKYHVIKCEFNNHEEKELPADYNANVLKDLSFLEINELSPIE